MRVLFLFLFFTITANSQSYLDYYFKSKGIEGAVVIYNQNSDEWIFNSESEAFTNTPAASHFHLWQTLVGLQEKVFTTDEKALVKWDGVKRSYFEERKTGWNRDMNLSDALTTQNDWYFNRLKSLLNHETYEKNIENASFFTDIKNNKVDCFWNFSGLTNPNAMILFLKALYEKKLPFASSSQEFLISRLSIDKNLILHTSSTSYLGKKIDWTIGIYLKQAKPVYFSFRTKHSLEEEKATDFDHKRNLILSEIFEVLNL